MKLKWLTAAGLMTMGLTVHAAPAELASLDQRMSYLAGFQFGQNLVREGLVLDETALLMAVRDAIAGTQSRLSMAELQAAATEFGERQQAIKQKQGEENRARGTAFLAENKLKPGVKTTKSGLQYKVLTEGKGVKPKPADEVTVHYRGTLIDGREFDSSYARGEPASFPVEGVIQGWQEVLPMMPVGSKWQVVIPSDLAYGPRGSGAMIGPDAVLIFEIDLVKIGK